MREPDKSQNTPSTKSTSENEGLPNGAKKFEDQEADKLLQDTWDQEVELYETYQRTLNWEMDMGNKDIPGLERFEIEISGPESKTFKGELHPKVEGRSWYRGVAIKADLDNPNNQVIIFSGWMQPWAETTLAPIVYTVGDISAQAVRTVIQRYTTATSSHIKRVRASHSNQGNA